jgi:hypothetical protein
MPFIAGEVSGRPKGSEGKDTKRVREAITAITEGGITNLNECLKQANNTNHKLLATKEDKNGNITGCYVHSDANDNTYNMYGENNKSNNDSYVLYGLVPKEQLKDIGSKNINCKDINDNIININPSEIDSKCKISCINNNGELTTGIFNETINKCKLSTYNNNVNQLSDMTSVVNVSQSTIYGV